jgi:hypothetical protein
MGSDEVLRRGRFTGDTPPDLEALRRRAEAAEVRELIATLAVRGIGAADLTEDELHGFIEANRKVRQSKLDPANIAPRVERMRKSMGATVDTGRTCQKRGAGPTKAVVS